MVQIKTVDLVKMAGDGSRQRTVLMNGPNFHTWINVYPPGEMDEMHCHNADQTFYLVSGVCTINYPDGRSEKMQPGHVALMPGGQFYQLYNADEEPVVLLGTRAISSEKGLKIDYETRQPIEYRPKDKPAPTGTRILV